MTLEHFDFSQNSPEWFEARMGIPTSSEFGTVLAKGRTKSEESITRRKYLNRLAAERYMGQVCEEAHYTNAHLERGHLMEPEAADLYAFAHDCELEMVGFFKDSDKGAGCSPDRRRKPKGLISIKTALPHILTDYIRRDQFPPEHKPQSQGELWITGEPFLDLVIYWPGMPLFIKRCTPDAEYIAELAAAIKTFNAELDAIVETLNRYGQPTNIKDDLRGSIIAHDEMMAQLKEKPSWA